MISFSLSMNPYEQIAKAIIDKIAFVLGWEVSLGYAKKVNGLIIGGDNKITISKNPEQVIADLVDQYRAISGPAAITFSQSAARPIMKDHPDLSLPEILKVKI